MEKQIIFKCESCNEDNKRFVGTQGYEFAQTKFELFSDAVKHVIENPSHWMIAELDLKSED